MTKKSFILLTFLIASSLQVVAREVFNLNKGWQFGAVVHNVVSSVKVDVPHSWNHDELQSVFGENSSSVYYIREVKIPSSWDIKNTSLRFYGVASKATLYVNGQYVGEHNGAYTAFTFDISHFLKYGAVNTIQVYVQGGEQIDNMPLVPRFSQYGGIFRDVELILNEREHISVTHYSSNGVYVSTKKISDEVANLNVDVMLRGSFGDRLTTKVKIFDGDKIVSEGSGVATISTDGSSVISIPMLVKKPRLWNGKKSPFMYRAEVYLLNASKDVRDKVVQPFGIRIVSIDRKKGFLLNGNAYPIYGMLMKQENILSGLNFSRENSDDDISFLKEVGATSVRFANGSHSQYDYNLCDKSGVIVWNDLPFCGDEFYSSKSFINSFAFKNSGIIQLKEMIWQLYNHPSIAFWGLFSNLSGNTESPVEYVKELNEVATLISPNCITVGVSNQDGEINNVTDVISWSQYFGWKRGETKDFGMWLSQFEYGWQKLKPAVGEYGISGKIDKFSKVKSKKEISNFRTEQEQLDFHIDYLKAIKNRSYFWGYYVNSLFDSPEYSSLYTGLVTSDRKYKKDAFYLYKANWNKEDEFVHLAKKRSYYRSSTIQNICVMTNMSTVELKINGKIVSEKKQSDGVVLWKNVKVKYGINVIEVNSGEFSDKTEFVVTRRM
ncbi:MAG: hypothetical protein IMY73_03190 [Bacteroidetes bacterium]|nr:hypothetical protein [Bacteroidota bacterium]